MLNQNFLAFPGFPHGPACFPARTALPVPQHSKNHSLSTCSSPPQAFCSRRRPLSITGGRFAEQMPRPLSSSAQSEHSKTTVFNVQVHENRLTEEGGPGNTHAAFQVPGTGLKYKFGSKPSPDPLLLSWGHLWVNGTFKEA